MVTRKRKVYVILMSAGALTLFVDRCVLNESATSVESATAEIAVTMPVAEVTDDTSNPPIPQLPFPVVPSLAPRDILTRDVFAPPAAVWSSVTVGAGNGIKIGENNSTARFSAVTFGSHNQLNGVLAGGGLKIAIVNGSWLRIGESRNGCVLKSVSGNTALFSCHDGDIKISIEDSVSQKHD